MLSLLDERISILESLIFNSEVKRAKSTKKRGRVLPPKKKGTRFPLSQFKCIHHLISLFCLHVKLRSLVLSFLVALKPLLLYSAKTIKIVAIKRSLRRDHKREEREGKEPFCAFSLIREREKRERIRGLKIAQRVD